MNKGSILVVDDQANIRGMLAELFRSEGYTVHEAMSGVIAQDKLNTLNIRFTFVLIDQVLEGDHNGGTKIVKQIRGLYPDLLILMYTADPSIKPIIKWEALCAGAHRYIQKTSPKELLNNINMFIRDMTDLQELTRRFSDIASDRLEMSSALFGTDVGVLLIDQGYRVWFANKAHADIVGQPNIIGAPCWSYLHNFPVSQGPCFGCTVRDAFSTRQVQTRTFLSPAPSGELCWTRILTTPIFTQILGSEKRVIAAKKATVKLEGAVKQMEFEERLRCIAQCIVLLGYGRARIYKASGGGHLKCIAAAAGPNSKADESYRRKTIGFETEISQNQSAQQALGEIKGTLFTELNERLDGSKAMAGHLQLKAPWIDFPIWDVKMDQKILVGWLGVDIVDGQKNELSQDDIHSLWPITEEIRRALIDHMNPSESSNHILRETIAGVKISIVAAQETVEALKIIFHAISTIMPCYDIQVRVREDGMLRLLQQYDNASRRATKILSEDDPNSLCGYVIKSRNPFYIPDIEGHKERIRDGEPLPFGIDPPRGPSLAILPLQVGWTFFGVLRIEPKNLINWDEIGTKAALGELSSLAALLVRDYVINRQLSEGKSAAEREAHLAFGAIHGVKGPSQALRNNLKIILERNAEGTLTTDKAVDIANSAMLCLTRIERLAERLLRLVRRTPGITTVEDTRIILGVCIEENRMLHPNMTILSEFKEGSEKIIVNEVEFRLVVDELITNSAKATEDEGQVKFSCKKEGDFVSIIVKDNGFGVEHDDLERIFERWYSKFLVKGSGLGLAFVKTVVEDFGGKVTAQNDDQGFRIVLQIPTK